MEKRDLNEMQRQYIAHKIQLRRLFYKSLGLFLLVNLFVLINVYLPAKWNGAYFWLMLLWLVYIILQCLRSYTNWWIFNDRWEENRIKKELDNLSDVKPKPVRTKKS
jgi:hypothetical protein